MSKICDECETVAHCTTHGCIPKTDFWEGYVPEPVKPAQQEYERGFIDGMQEQMRRSVDRAVNAMAQRTWVGLTDEEIYSVLENLQVMYNRPPTTDSRIIFARAIEAKLKEKNNG